MNPEKKPFRAAAGRARNRLVLARWFALLKRSAPPVFAAAAALLLALRLGGMRWGELPAAAALAGVWFTILALWAVLRRPTALAALALWDERAGRREALASAYCFEAAAQPSLGERRHLDRAREMLDRARPSLRRDLPTRFALRALLLPAAFLALSASGLLRAEASTEEAALEEGARRRARRAAEVLNEKIEKFKGMKGLKPEELKAAERLKEKLEATAEKMRAPGKTSSREILAELERRAKEAEKLARELAAGDIEASASKMIDELARHADTAKLGAALKANDLDGSKLSAEQLAAKLKDKGLTKEVSKRVKEALKKALKAADADDMKSKLGQKLRMAHEEMKKGRPKKAGDRFSELAEHFAGRKQRERARRQLERLVKMMRETGWKLSGRELKRLRPREYDGMLEPLPEGLTMLKEGGLPGNRESWLPGKPGRLGVGMLPGSGKGAGLIPGSGSGEGFGMGGMTPVPGTEAAGVLPGGGGTGGLRAGRGTAPLGKKPTRPHRTTGTGVVKARPGKDGASVVRLVEPSGHKETAYRVARKVAVDFIKAEEATLDEELLPLSRREQILRYFTALRRQLER